MRSFKGHEQSWWMIMLGSFTIFCLLATTKALQTSDTFVSARSAMKLAASRNDEPSKLSPAGSSIETELSVRQILRQRSTRGKPAELDSRPARSRKAPDSSKAIKASASKPKSKAKKAKSSTRKPPTSSKYKAPRGHSLSYATTIEALQVYHERHSNLVLPRRYVVEKNCGYPRECLGIDLAGTVYNMRWWTRHVKERPDRVAELNQLGFVWERLQPEWNLILEALITYRSLQGDMLVPAKFVVPYNDRNWSRATWGLALGNAVYRIRNRGDFLRGSNAIQRRDQLDGLDFVWNVQEHLFDKFCQALRAYSRREARKDVHARLVALKVPARFVIPSTEDWPEELWGYPLGEKCTAVRQKELYIKGDPERLRILADIGFFPGGNDNLSWLEVVHAAAVYSQLHDRSLDVAASFVVPEPPRRKEDVDKSESLEAPWPWPEYLWGFPLGQRLRDIRVKGYYLRGDSADARRQQLDALGFDWSPKRGRPRNTSTSSKP